MTNNFPEIKYNIYLFALILAVCFAFSAGVRFQQFETWEKTPSYYFVGELPLMTTLDAPYWLRFARNYNNGKYVKDSRFGIDYLRGYPTNSEILNELTSQKKFTDHFHSQPTSEVKKYKYSDIHLLSFLIAKLVPYFNYNYYLTGTLLIPVLASLFILPLGIYFFRLGVPISGLLGGLIGTFAGGYYMRSSIGRIDTDSLNLFFPALIALMILLAILSKSERSVLLYSICAGLSLFCFQWWYSKEGFSLVYFTVLVISLFLQKIRFGIILFSALLFVLCVHPETFMNGIVSIVGFVERYFSIDIKNDVLINNGTIPAIFPNTMTTISEVEHVTTDEIIRRVLSNTFLGWVGLITFLALAIWRWKVLLPLVPMLALGLLSFQSSNRFIMFLGPFIGLGLGWLAQLGFEFIFFLIAKTFVHRKVKDGYKVLSNKSALYIKFDVKSVSKKNRSPLNTGQDLSLDTLESNTVNKEITDINWWNWVRQVVLYLGIGGIFWGISAQTAMSFVPRPSIHPQIYASFLDVKKLVPPNSAILTWWDYGYAITDATDLATFHDGGVQKSPKTYFIARSLISPDQDEFYNITQFLATEGNLGIEKNNSSVGFTSLSE